MRRNEPTRIFPRPYFNPQIAEHNSPATRAPRPSYTTLRNCSFLILNPPDAIYCSTRKKVILLYRNNLGLVILIFFNILNGNTIHKKFVTTYFSLYILFTVFVFAFSYLLWLLIDTHKSPFEKKETWLYFMF